MKVAIITKDSKIEGAEVWLYINAVTLDKSTNAWLPKTFTNNYIWTMNVWNKGFLNQTIKLGASDTWNEVYISPDLIAKDRDASEKLRDEIKQHRDARERNLMIKRGRIYIIYIYIYI